MQQLSDADHKAANKLDKARRTLNRICGHTIDLTSDESEIDNTDLLGELCISQESRISMRKCLNNMNKQTRQK